MTSGTVRTAAVELFAGCTRFLRLMPQRLKYLLLLLLLSHALSIALIKFVVTGQPPSALWLEKTVAKITTKTNVSVRTYQGLPGKIHSRPVTQTEDTAYHLENQMVDYHKSNRTQKRKDT